MFRGIFIGDANSQPPSPSSSDSPTFEFDVVNVNNEWTDG